MKAFIIMEQKEFEEAIQKFTVKVTNETNGLVEYQVTRRPKTTVINILTYVEPVYDQPNVNLRNPKKAVKPYTEPENFKPKTKHRARGCTTPDGSFESIVAAARFYNIDKSIMCSRVTARVKKGVPGWSFINYD